MALRLAASRCRQRFWCPSSSSSTRFLERREWSLKAGCGATTFRDWNLPEQQQKRSYGKAAADTQAKVATPNAAKNVKAKNATKKEEKKEARERFNDLIDACLNAPSPLSPLKEKDRLRLLEREKLGIVTEERLREIEQEKAWEKLAKAAAKKAAKEVKTKPVEIRFEGQEVREAVSPNVTAPAESKFVLTTEEGKRLAKECSRVLLNEDRQRAKEEAVRLQLKKEAIAALPPHLREAALVPDLTPFPKSRIPASLSPPIKGYIDNRATAAAQAVTVKKSR